MTWTLDETLSREDMKCCFEPLEFLLSARNEIRATGNQELDSVYALGRFIPKWMWILYLTAVNEVITNDLASM